MLAGVRRLAGELGPDATIVAIAPDLGGLYVDTVYNDNWCDDTYGQAWRDALGQIHVMENLENV